MLKMLISKYAVRILFAAVLSLQVVLIMSCKDSVKYLKDSVKYLKVQNDLFTHHTVERCYPHGHISTQYAGDMDGDGFLDIVIRSGKSGAAEIAIYQNPLKVKQETDRKWDKVIISQDEYPSGSKSSGTGLLLHDINKDGRLDVITGAKIDGLGNGLFWWKSPGTSVMDNWERYLIASPDTSTGEEFAPHDLILADIDKDGVLDIIIGGSSNQGVYWARIPEGMLAQQKWQLMQVGRPRGYAYAGLAVGDIDHDGRYDVVHADAWYRAVGPVSTPRWEMNLFGLINGPPSNIKIYDVDKDANLDIIVASGHNPDRGEVVWYKSGSDPARPWEPHKISGFLAAPENLVVFDYQNGRIGIITAELDFRNTKEKRSVILYTIEDMDSQRWNETLLHVGNNFHMMRSADLDNDGDLDLYAASFEEANGCSHVDWFENISQ